MAAARVASNMSIGALSMPRPAAGEVGDSDPLSMVRALLRRSSTWVTKCAMGLNFNLMVSMSSGARSNHSCAGAQT